MEIDKDRFAAARAAKAVMTYKVEVQTTGPRGPWNGNQLRFAKESDAQSYGCDLFTRWSQVTAWRVARSQDPATHRWDGRMAVALDAAEERVA